MYRASFKRNSASYADTFSPIAHRLTKVASFGLWKLGEQSRDVATAFTRVDFKPTTSTSGARNFCKEGSSSGCTNSSASDCSGESSEKWYDGAASSSFAMGTVTRAGTLCGAPNLAGLLVLGSL